MSPLTFKAPWGLAGMLALVVLVEAGLTRHADALCDWMAFTWRAAGRAAREEGARAEVLCLGDSLVKEGVLPRVVGRELGVSAYNLAVHGGQAPSSDFLLRRALRAGARPRVVVVDFHPNLLAAAPRSSAPYWSDLLGAPEAVELGWNARDARLFFQTAALGLWPSLKNRDAIRAVVRAALRGELTDDARLCRALARNFRRNLGARVSPVKPPPADPEAVFRNLPDLGRWKPHRANVASMHRLFTRAERAGAVVVWLLPPTSPAWQARRRAIGADEPYERLARAMQAAHPNLVVADGRPASYPPEAFYDLTHLHVEAATEFSAALARVIARRLEGSRAGPRWVALPPFRKGPRDRSLEDLDESKVAALGGGVRR